ncbi:hypothetical protein J3R82DRAFT_10636 [Butyriboletus roseoflavus]|nr:hypothetical protein J3R82DRAFT_10636 [Butyriboletus roseoflavus]
MTATNTKLTLPTRFAQQSTISKSKMPSKPKTAKKPKFDHSGDESSPAREEGKQPAIKVLKNAEGEKYVDLGKKRRAAARYLSTYASSMVQTAMKSPGRKASHLPAEQWEALKLSVGTIDSLFAEV